MSIDQRRDLRIVTRVSGREWEVLRQRAHDCGLGTSTFLRQLGLGNVPRARPHLRKKKILFELARIGGHLKEIQSWAEREEIPEIPKIEQAMEEVLAATRRVR